jgi:DNA-binding NtrC family response regulator
MMGRGAILDVSNGMTQLACTVAAGYRTDRSRPTPKGQRKISTAARKFPRHVLVVDDEPLIRWSIAESLSDAGIDVEQACDAASALRKVTGTPPPFDAVVLDLRLPDMDDLSLLGTLRQLMPDAVLILMTAFGTQEIVAAAEAMGAVVVNKPFELDAVKRLVLEPRADVR